MFRSDVRVTYNEELAEVVALDAKDRVVLRTPLWAGQRPFEVAGDYFLWGSRELLVPEKELGMAMAFAHYVNQRVPQTAHERHLGAAMPGAQRWQYGVINVGMFQSAERMQQVLATAGANGWELVGVYDKASNWLRGMEKGFMMLKRPVTDIEPAESCVAFQR